MGRVSSQVLIGKEKNLVGSLQGPTHDLGCIRRSADRAAVTAAKCLDGRGRVHIGDRDDFPRSEAFQFLPARLDLVGSSHVGHRTAGAEIRQDHFLIVRAQNVGAFGHEVYAAKDDVLGVLAIGSPLGELEGVPANVGELDDLISLIMMA